MAAGGLADQRQTEAVSHQPLIMFGRPASGEGVCRRRVVQAAAAVADLQHKGAGETVVGGLVLDPAAEADAAWPRCRRGRVDRVVEQVADDRDQVAGGDDSLGDRAGRVDLKLDAALVGLGGLAQQQRGKHRLVDGPDDHVGELLGLGELGSCESQRLFCATQLDQADHAVQPVGCLVGL